MPRWLLVETLEQPPGLLQLDIDLGYMASPRMAQWAEQGVYIIARPWPQGGTLFTKDDFTLDFAHGTVTCPGGQTSRWSRAKTPGFPPAPVMGVHSERSAPQLGSVKGETCISGRTTRSSTSSVPRSKPSADVPRCANAPRWSMRYPITSRIKDGVPAIRGYARTSLMAAAMRRSVTSKWRPIMKRNYSSLPEV